jgi:spermidine/putrescine transport system substrate-binding protein
MGKRVFCLSALIAFLISGCGLLPSPSAEATPSDDLVLYGWVDYMPQTVMDQFESKFGVKIRYVFYESQEEAAENIRMGEAYDLVVLGPELIPDLIADGNLRPMEYELIPNFKYISLNFRDLSFDPGNKYSIPFHWGNTGILVRNDLVDRPITSWNDLWNPAFEGKVGMWALSRDVISITLKGLGYSINTHEPDELERARKRLMELKPNATKLPGDIVSIVPLLEAEEIFIGFGWAYDATLAAESKFPIEYIIPREGSILWSDHWVIPANATNPKSAQDFINFILQPDISAEIINYSYYPIPHDGALPFIADEILSNTSIYPPLSFMEKSELILPLTDEISALYDSIWADYTK